MNCLLRLQAGKLLVQILVRCRSKEEFMMNNKAALILLLAASAAGVVFAQSSNTPTTSTLNATTHVQDHGATTATLILDKLDDTLADCVP